MKAKKNLYEAPATKVVEIVLDYAQDVHAFCCDEEGDFHEECLNNVAETLNALQEWKMPIDVVKKIIKTNPSADEAEEEIINAILKEYHKTKAA